MLASFKYLPSFCGRWELELYPNWNNIVIIPCDIENLSTPSEWALIREETAQNWDKVTDHFVQIGEPFTMVDWIDFAPPVAAAQNIDFFYLTSGPWTGGGDTGSLVLPTVTGEDTDQ
jgi:hypothetical protein